MQKKSKLEIRNSELEIRNMGIPNLESLNSKLEEVWESGINWGFGNWESVLVSYE
jgi:hypothetical protein